MYANVTKNCQISFVIINKSCYFAENTFISIYGSRKTTDTS